MPSNREIRYVAYECRNGVWQLIHANYEELRDARIAMQYAQSKGREAVTGSFCPLQAGV